MITREKEYRRCEFCGDPPNFTLNDDYHSFSFCGKCKNTRPLRPEETLAYLDVLKQVPVSKGTSLVCLKNLEMTHEVIQSLTYEYELRMHCPEYEQSVGWGEEGSLQI